MIKPHMLGKEYKYMKQAFRSNWIAPLGNFVDLFESRIKEYVSSEYAVAVSSGTSAIHLALKCAGIGNGDIVFVPDMTFIASANPVIYEGAKPVFIDSDDSDGNMSVSALKKAFLKYTPKAVIVVSLYGIPAKLDEIRKLCDEHKCLMIEDSTEALGSTFKGKHAGTFGHIGCFSFNGNKIITASVGGMVVTDNEAYAKKILNLATQARVKGMEYAHDDIGYNYRLSNICAAIGVGQLEKIEKKISIKKRINNIYSDYFANKSYGNIVNNDNLRRNNYWISCLKLNIPNARKLVEFLAEKHVEARLFWKPLHTQKIFDYDFVSFRNISCKLFETCVCLPSDTNMTRKEQLYVCNCIDEFFRSENVQR